MLNLRLVFVRLAALWVAVAAATASAADFLDPAEAFRPTVQQDGAGRAVLQVAVAPHCHLYRQRFQLQDAAGSAVAAALPPGRDVLDAALGEQVSVWEHDITVSLPTPPAPTTWSLSYQGCADEGLCYPPQHASLRWEPSAGGLQVHLLADAADASPTASPPDEAAAESDRVTRALASGHVLTVIGVFVVFGLLLSFTPCVLPMLPILSSIIVGQSQPVSRGRGFSLAASYSLGMALVYTAMGMLAGWLGQGLGAVLQNPWTLGAFALLLAALSLSMFGVWEFQMPGFIQQRLAAGQNRLPGGKHLGVFVMGALSALLVGPCVAAPLAGVLVYISRTRDLVLGGAALFALACGMSVPLLLLGVSAGRLLPRAGAWMERVKTVFGVLLLATAVWLVWPVLPASVTALVAADPRAASAAPAFRRVRSEAELQQALAQAGGRPVLLDYYADWCVACKEMEHLTFGDPSVRERLQHALLLQADVTADSAESRALLKRFGLFGPPGIVFLDAHGRERDAALRVIGFMPAKDFAGRLQRAGL
jgi:thiol:disulfide interchange protein DsbD